MPDPLQPPVPFDDFTFAFDPALHNLFPSPPPLPSSADLFSPSETTDLLGFLDNFIWDLEETQIATNEPSLPHPHPDVPPAPLTIQSVLTTSASQRGPEPMPEMTSSPPDMARMARSQSQMSSNSSSSTSTIIVQGGASGPSRSKPLLSTPQKRLNHIMSEQKRRNAIRDGYVQLTGLLAPAGAPPGAGMPTRGRPKGSGSRASGRGGAKGVSFKGKSGILFRAVEYIRWLEEGRDALLGEVLKVESAAGIPHS